MNVKKTDTSNVSKFSSGEAKGGSSANGCARRYINRELSWLSFNDRVLSECYNERHPLLERVRFLSISGSNLDEFYMVRVAGLHAQADEEVTVQSVEGMTPQEQLIEVNKKANQLMINQQNTWQKLKGILKNVIKFLIL